MLGAVDDLRPVSRAADWRIGLSYDNLYGVDEGILAQDSLGDKVGQAFNEIEAVGRYDLVHVLVDHFVVNRPRKVIVDRGVGKVETHRHVNFEPPADPVLFLHHAVVGVEDRIYETDGAFGHIRAVRAAELDGLQTELLQ